MKDPVNNFEIPPEWIERANIPEGEGDLKAGIASGRLVVLADGTVLKRGYTTGTTAAAAAKAAVLSLSEPVDRVTVTTPVGIAVVLEVQSSDGRASAVKDAGDHGFDVTNGIRMWLRRMNRRAYRLRRAGASGGSVARPQSIRCRCDRSGHRSRTLCAKSASPVQMS